MEKIKQRWALVAPYLKRHRKGVLLGLFLVILSTALDQVGPWMIKLFLDHLEAKAPWLDIATPLLVFVGIIVVSSIFLYFQRQLVIVISRKIEYEIRRDLFQKFQAQPRSFYDKRPIGDLMSNGTNDLDRIRDFLGPVILHLARMLSNTVFTLVGLWLLHPTLTLWGLIPILILPLFVNRFLTTMHTLHSRIQKSLGVLNTFIQDTVSGIQVVKAYGKEDTFYKKFTQHSEDLKKHSMSVAFFTAAMWPLIGLLSSLGILLVIWFGARMVIEQTITIGTLTAAFLYLMKLAPPLAGLGWVSNLLQRASAAMDRIIALEEDFSKEPQDATEAQGDTQKGVQKNRDFSLELKNLSFAYATPRTQSTEQEHALQNISLKIPMGSSLGIVGPTGSGKSTLLHLLCGIYTPPQGSLYMGGVERHGFTSQEWKRSFSLTPQDGFLFSQSIRENIELGKNAHSTYSLEDVGALSGFSKDLPQIKEGYEALLGERGINLSGGQRQRVGLARAMLAGSSILCLDDTLSALDTETESEILSNLKNQFEAKTLVVVSHRYSSVSHCDHIIFLNNGAIAEQGTHEELIRQDGLYAKVYRKQKLTQDLEET